MEKKIVIMAHNIREGGPLTILNNILKIIENHKKNNFIIFVYKKKLLNKNKFSKNVKIVQIPNYKKNFLRRIYYDFIFFPNFSKNENPDLWISLQDTIPNILAKKKIIYFHTPIGFYKMNLKEIFFEPIGFIRSFYYRYVYKLERYKNSTVIVQQNWIKRSLNKRFKFKRIIVNRPYNLENVKVSSKKIRNKELVFFYPSLPRFQKNFEMIVCACKLLKNYRFKVFFTFKKNENLYSRYIYQLSKNTSQIRFIGRKSHKQIMKLYQHIDILIFSSKLETWGLPLSEATHYFIPVLAPKLPYAQETLLDYNNKYLYKYNLNSLLKKMKYLLINDALLKKKIKYSHFKNKKKFEKYWNEIFN